MPLSNLGGLFTMICFMGCIGRLQQCSRMAFVSSILLSSSRRNCLACSSSSSFLRTCDDSRKLVATAVQPRPPPDRHQPCSPRTPRSGPIAAFCIPFASPRTSSRNPRESFSAARSEDWAVLCPCFVLPPLFFPSPSSPSPARLFPSSRSKIKFAYNPFYPLNLVLHLRCTALS